MIAEEVKTQREMLHKAVDELPPESLKALGVFIRFLQHKNTHPGSAWFRTLYELFEPVRQGILESGMSEDEVNAAIDEAITEVRRERKGN